MVRVPDFCPARFHQASANIVSDQPKKAYKTLRKSEKKQSEGTTAGNQN
jgi:hypothetical protein